MEQTAITTLFLDIGGVLLSNGWDRGARKRAAETFHLDYADMDERHHLTFDTYEEGKLSLDDYLRRVIFNQERPFSLEEFKTFMYSCSVPFDDMLELIRSIKARHHLRTIAVSNEGRELNAYRIHKYHLDQVVDTFVSSSYVHFRKPDSDIFKIALDVSHSTPGEVAYIDDRPLFIEVANGLHIHGILHQDVATTRLKLAELGLDSD